MKYIVIISLVFLFACTKNKDKDKEQTSKAKAIEVKIPDNPLEECMDGTGATFGAAPIMKHKMPHGFTLIMCGETQENELYSNFNIYPVDKNKKPQPRVLMVEKGNLVKLDFATEEVKVTELIPLGEKVIPYLSATITCDEKQCVRSASACAFEKIQTKVKESILAEIKNNQAKLDEATILKVVELALSGNQQAIASLDELELGLSISDLEARENLAAEANESAEKPEAATSIDLNSIRSAVANLQSLGCLK